MLKNENSFVLSNQGLLKAWKLRRLFEIQWLDLFEKIMYHSWVYGVHIFLGVWGTHIPGCMGYTYSRVCGVHMFQGVWSTHIPGCMGYTYSWVYGVHIFLGVWSTNITGCMGYTYLHIYIEILLYIEVRIFDKYMNCQLCSHCT